MDLFSNQLTGTLPESIGQLTSLTRLSVGDNQMSGTVPPGIGNLLNLQDLDLYENSFQVRTAGGSPFRSEMMWRARALECVHVVWWEGLSVH